MNKLQIKKQGGYFTIKLPDALITYIKNFNTKSAFTDCTITVKENKMHIVIYSGNLSYNTSKLYEHHTQSSTQRTSKLLKKEPFYIYCNKHIHRIYIKNNIANVCNNYYINYKIYESDTNFIITAAVLLEDVINANHNNTSAFNNIINTVLGHGGVLNMSQEFKDEYYHYIAEENNTIVYLTKQKYLRYLLSCSKNGTYNPNVTNTSMLEDTSDNILKVSRKSSYSKFFKKLLGDNYNENDMNAYYTYNALLSSYNPELFEVVSGDDILKYYKEETYFKSTGELGTSCMRYDSYQAAIEFYSRNKNVKLIILKIKEVDKIIGRALVWTTTDGEKVMDRIYTSDTKVISLFHKYAEDNNLLNVYNYKIWNSSNYSKKKDITKMSPNNWDKNYTEQFIVDLDYLPTEVHALTNARKYSLHLERFIHVSNSLTLPYLDNFNLINIATNQISLLPIKDKFMCPISNTVLTRFNMQYTNTEVYNCELVTLLNDGTLSLKSSEDIVELNDDLDCDFNLVDTSNDNEQNNAEIVMNVIPNNGVTHPSITQYFNISTT